MFLRLVQVCLRCSCRSLLALSKPFWEHSKSSQRVLREVSQSAQRKYSQSYPRSPKYFVLFYKMLRSKDFPDDCSDFQISTSYLKLCNKQTFDNDTPSKVLLFYTSFALLKTPLRFIIFLWLIIGKTNQTTMSKREILFSSVNGLSA